LAILTAFYFSTLSTKLLVEIFKALSIIGIVGLIYVFSVESIDLDLALTRGYTWTEIFYYSPLFWAVIPGIILAFLYDKNLILTICYWCGAILLNLMFLKRFIIVDSLLLILVLLFINYHKEKKIISGAKVYALLAIIVSVGLYFYSDFILGLFEATNER